MYNCELCGSLGREVRLIGGLHTVLCNKCTNLWSEHCNNSKSVGILRSREAALFAVVQSGDPLAASAASWDATAAKTVVYKESLDWIKKMKGETE